MSTASAGARWSRWSKRNPREPLTLRVRYRGGNEAWYLVEARGTQAAFPGHMALHDVLQEINLGQARYIQDDRP